MLVMVMCWLVISTWSPPKSLACQKGFRLGSWVDLEVSWALAAGKQPASSCMRECVLVVVLVEILLF